MRSIMARQATLTVGVVIVAGVLLSLAFRGPDDASAVWLSGVVAIAVQLAAFSLSRVVGVGNNITARMGAGALLRLLALVAYALVVVLVLKLPAVAALVSLATFFFLSTVIEPLLIKS